MEVSDTVRRPQATTASRTSRTTGSTGSTQQGTDADGRVIGYGTDIGPEGICYNGKLFEAAGLPSDREAVAELFGGDDATWEDYFEVGEQYTGGDRQGLYDHSGFVWNAMVNQLDEGYYTADGELNVEGNAELKERCELLAAPRPPACRPRRRRGTGTAASRSSTAPSRPSCAPAGCSAS